MKLMLLVQLCTTLFMVGLIWFVQIVHYPLFAHVGSEQFARYEQLHQRLTTFVVAPVMLLELASALGLIGYASSGIVQVSAWLGLMLVGMIWLSTWMLQVPAHARLTAGFTTADHARLVATNWIRTGAWTVRGILMLWLTIRHLQL